MLSIELKIHFVLRTKLISSSCCWILQSVAVLDVLNWPALQSVIFCEKQYIQLSDVRLLKHTVLNNQIFSAPTILCPTPTIFVVDKTQSWEFWGTLELYFYLKLFIFKWKFYRKMFIKFISFQFFKQFVVLSVISRWSTGRAIQMMVRHTKCRSVEMPVFHDVKTTFISKTFKGFPQKCRKMW